MANTSLTYNRGTTKNWTVNYTPGNGVNGATVLFTVKEDVDESTTDATALVKKNIAMTANSAVITLAPADIADTFDEGEYVYDLKVIDANGNVYLLVESKFVLNVSATNRYS